MVFLSVWENSTGGCTASKHFFLGYEFLCIATETCIDDLLNYTSSTWVAAGLSLRRTAAYSKRVTCNVHMCTVCRSLSRERVNALLPLDNGGLVRLCPLSFFVFFKHSPPSPSSV